MKFTKNVLIAGVMALGTTLAAGAASAGDYRQQRAYDDGAYDTYRTMQIGHGYGYSRSYGSRYYRNDYRTLRPAYRVRAPRLVENHDQLAGRTRFCKYETRYKGYNGRRVKVKRCVFVRNDLLGVYAEKGWSRY